MNGSVHVALSTALALGVTGSLPGCGARNGLELGSDVEVPQNVPSTDDTLARYLVVTRELGSFCSEQARPEESRAFTCGYGQVTLDDRGEIQFEPRGECLRETLVLAGGAVAMLVDISPPETLTGWASGHAVVLDPHSLEPIAEYDFQPYEYNLDVPIGCVDPRGRAFVLDRDGTGYLVLTADGSGVDHLPLLSSVEDGVILDCVVAKDRLYVVWVRPPAQGGRTLAAFDSRDGHLIEEFGNEDGAAGIPSFWGDQLQYRAANDSIHFLHWDHDGPASLQRVEAATGVVQPVFVTADIGTRFYGYVMQGDVAVILGWPTPEDWNQGRVYATVDLDAEDYSGDVGPLPDPLRNGAGLPQSGPGDFILVLSVEPGVGEGYWEDERGVLRSWNVRTGSLGPAKLPLEVCQMARLGAVQ